MAHGNAHGRETEAEPLLPVVLHSLQAEGVAFLEDGLQVLKTQWAVAVVSPELQRPAGWNIGGWAQGLRTRAVEWGWHTSQPSVPPQSLTTYGSRWGAQFLLDGCDGAPKVMIVGL